MLSSLWVIPSYSICTFASWVAQHGKPFYSGYPVHHHGLLLAHSEILNGCIPCSLWLKQSKILQSKSCVLLLLQALKPERPEYSRHEQNDYKTTTQHACPGIHDIHEPTDKCMLETTGYFNSSKPGG